MKKASKNKKSQNSSHAQVQDFLAGGGELGELIRTKDWSKTPLGPVENWPKSLRTIVRIMLTSQQPIWIGWGPALIKLYNDPYKSIVGGKHPKALGQPASVVWKDIWKDIEPLLKQVMEKNQGTYSESQLLIMERNGYPEETYYTFSYSPVPGDEGGVEGMICANTDDTQRVIGERQLASLRELAAQTADAKTIDEGCTLSATALQANTKDIPFGIIYRVDQAKKTVSLAGTIAIDQTYSAVPKTIAWDSDDIWPIAKVLKTKEVCVVSDLGKYFDDLPKGAWDQPPHQAVAVPIMQPGYVTGILVVGLNPYRLFDDNYRRYLNLVSGQIASSLSNAQAYEEEKKRAEALAEIDRAKTLFFSNVSHEFRTPLTLMLGPVQDMLNEPLDAVQRKDLEVVHRNGLRLQKLVNSLLDFSRIEEGRVQARQKVEETQKQLKLALSAGSVGIWIWDIQQDRVVSDERLAYFFGADPHKATTEGLPLDAFVKAIHAEDRPRIKELIAQTVKTGESYKAEYRVVGSDGKMRWVVAQGKVERDAKGNPVRFPGVLIDITERIQAEEALRQSELRFKTYAEAMPQMAFMADPEGNIIYYNQRWYDFVAGMKDTEGWGWKDKPIHHPDDLQRTIDRWTESIRTGNPYEIEYRLRHHDGEYRWHLGRAVPVCDSQGKIEMWLGTNTDIHEQKQAEEALRKSEEYYKTMTDNTPVITWITQPDASCSYLNKQWYEFTGQTPATGLGFGWLEVIHPDDAAKSREIFFEANEKHIPFSLEYRLKGKDGQYRWHLDSGLPKFDDQGNFEGFVGSVIDIHERRLAEERLRESEERFRTLADNISNLCWMANADGWIYWYNSRWYEYTGTDPKEMEGWGWQSVHDPQVLPQVLEKWKACIATGKPLDMAFPLRRADGVFRPFLTRAMPVKDENGNILHWFGTNTDITALREAEEKLSYQKSLLEAQQEVSPLGILVVSPKGKILTYNHRFADMWNFPQEIMETELDKVALKSAQEQLNDPDAFMRKVLNCYKKQVQNHEKLYFKDGRIFDRHGSPVKDEEGTYYGYVWFFQDITEQEHLAKQKDEFIGIASHELKTPVTSIKGSIQIIDRLFTDQSYEMIGNFLHKAELHVDKLTGLINDLLDVSKIQAGKLQYNFSEFTANDIIQDCVEEVSHQAKKHTIIVQGDTSIVVYGDKLRLEQVVSNLLTNAIKYSPEADEVIVEIAKENESLKISVTDFGIGIPEKKLANVFDRFFRVEQNAHQFQGLGIGLYICAEIIKRHGGKMQVKSTEGKGSTFYFTLPLNKSTAH